MSEQPTMRDKAVALAEMGFRVFPLLPRGKTPAVERFYEAASGDPQLVRLMWWSGHNCNIGISTDDLFVIDVDNKNGKDGEASLRALVEATGLDTNTVESATPTGGRHLFYRLPAGAKPIPNSTGKLGPGLDTRGWHGFVVAPGSVVPAGEYRWVRAPKEGWL